jgi:hypothetical protein
VKRANAANDNDGQYNCGEVYYVAAAFKTMYCFVVKDQQPKHFPKTDITQLHSYQSNNSCDSTNVFVPLCMLRFELFV